jgi:molybdopterin molybdotransferase
VPTAGSIPPWDGAVALDVAAASRWILSQLEPNAPIEVPLAASCGLVLATDAISTEPSPAFDMSAMDGYALHRDSGSPKGGWRVIGRLLAGDGFVGAVTRGEAVRIMTGAQVPPGVDVVAPLEIVAEHDGLVTLGDELAAGSNIRRTGSDHPAGAVIVDRGTRLTPMHLAVLASLGHDQPRVVPRARVGVLSTGDEVTQLRPGASGIRDANRPGLISLLEASGEVPVDLGVVGDDPVELRHRLEKAVSECDAVITTGGVSVGDHDYVKRVLAEAAGSTQGVARWMRVAVRPAKPLMFATIQGVPVFGLPGNPASAFVSYHLFARPALDRLAGYHDGASMRSFTATASVDFPRRRDGRLHVVPVLTSIASAVLSIRPAGPGPHHHLGATARANAYAYLPDGPAVPAGATVDCGWIAGTGLL